MKRNCCPGSDPSCELRTLGVRNSATTGAATATATATTAQPKFDKHLLAEQIRAARENTAGATESATAGATFGPVIGGSSCALNETNSSSVVIGPWKPATPEEVTEERRRVLEEEPRRWWWKPRYRLADLERAGMNHADAVDQVRAEFAARDDGR